MPTARVNGIKMYYEVHGKGDPLVLIHGSCFDVNGWAGQLDEFSKRYRVIVFDNRGVGRTDSPAPPYSTEEMATDTTGLMDALDIDRAHILGFSMGGCIAQELAVRDPGRVRSLILAGTAARMSPVGMARTLLFLRMLKEGVSPEIVMHNFMLWLFSDKFFENHENVTAAVQNYMNNPYPQPIDGLEGQAVASVEHDTRGRFEHITAPTMVVVGGEDILLPVKLSRELAAGIAGSELIIVEEAGHGLPLEAPERFNRVVLDFLARVDKA